MTRTGLLLGALVCIACAGDEDEKERQDAAVTADATGSGEGGSTGGVLRMPTGLGLDLDRTATTQGSSGSIAEAVSQGATFGDETDQVATLMLGPIGALNIPLDATVTTYSGAVTFGSTQLAVKIDFADYDADGDGTTEGCSGHTGALPVCMRVWVAGERYLEGQITVHAGDDTAGVGRFTAVKAKAIPGGETGMAITLRYDHRTRDSRMTELVWAMPADDPQQGPWASIRHLIAEAKGAPATAEKTINQVAQMPPLPGSTLSYLGRYQEDGTLWLGSVAAAGFFTQLGLKSFTTTCVELTTGQALAASQCAAAGLDLGSLTYVAPATPADVALSAGFPAAPTF